MKIYQFIVGNVEHPHTTDSINAHFANRKWLYNEPPQSVACTATTIDWFIANFDCNNQDALTLEVGVCTVEELSIGISLFFNKLLRHFFPIEEYTGNNHYCNIFLNYTYNTDLAVELTTACLVSFLNSGYNYKWEQSHNKNVCMRYIKRYHKQKLLICERGALLLAQNNVQPFGSRKSYGLLSVLSEDMDNKVFTLHDGSWDFYTTDLTEFPQQPHTFSWQNVPKL